MADNIKLPLLGETKKAYVYVGAAAVVGIVGFAYWRHSQNAGSASPSAYSSTPGTTATASSAGIDPATGYPYGSVEDTSALSSLGGGSGYAPLGGGGYGYTPTPITITNTVTKTKIGVPQITGSTQARAISAIQHAGLKPFPASIDAREGNVTSQSPAAGAEVSHGTTVFWSAKPSSKPPVTKKDKSFIAAGTTSLDQAASLRHVKTEEVVAETRKHSPGPLVMHYLAKGDFNDKLPRGSKWFY
jgi:hypothetical protein